MRKDCWHGPWLWDLIVSCDSRGFTSSIQHTVPMRGNGFQNLPPPPPPPPRGTGLISEWPLNDASQTQSVPPKSYKWCAGSLKTPGLFAPLVYLRRCQRSSSLVLVSATSQTKPKIRLRRRWSQGLLTPSFLWRIICATWWTTLGPSPTRNRTNWHLR